MSPAVVSGPVEWFAVTPGRGSAAELLAALPRLEAAGVRRLLLREKALTPEARATLARALVPACRGRGIEPWVSEDVALAEELGIGVHLAERSPSPLSLPSRRPCGLSLHEGSARTPAEVAAAAHAFLGPVFPTDKPAGGAPPLGVDRFLALARAIPVPVFALGGITRATLPALLSRGVRRIAAIRLFFGADDSSTLPALVSALLDAAETR